jgi:hypothetical protein
MDQKSNVETKTLSYTASSPQKLNGSAQVRLMLK